MSSFSSIHTMLFLSVLLFLLFLGLVTYYLFVLWQRYQYFNQIGVPTPPFRFLFGHLKTLWNCKSFHRQLESWTKQYGTIYGIYQGAIPTLVVSDPDFLQEVFIKQFSSFHGRRLNPMINRNRNVFTAWGEQWRRQRHIINPTFSAAKLKMMSPLINGCISNLMEKLAEYVETNEEFNIYMYYKRMTMDVICRCAFGVDTDLQNNPDNMYFKKVEEIFTRTDRMSSLFKFSQIMPALAEITTKIFFTINKFRAFINMYILPLVSNVQLAELPNVWLFNRLGPIIDQRQKTPTSRIDLLQLMMEAMTDEKIIDNEQDDSKTNYRLTREEVISNIFVFMAAGYETTSTALAYCTYVIATHPDVQDKLQAEIDQLPLVR